MSNSGSPKSPLRGGSRPGSKGGSRPGSKQDIRPRVQIIDPIQNRDFNSLNHVLDMPLVEKLAKEYENLVEDFPLQMGQAASKRDRETAEDPIYKESNFVYSEVSFETVAIAIQKIKKIYGKPMTGTSGFHGVLQHRGGIFYDLGCGTGKAVIAASLIHDFDTCYGIEWLGSLALIAGDLESSYNSRKKVVSKTIADREYDTHCTMVFGNMLDFGNSKKWDNADVVFCNTCTFTNEYMNKLAELAGTMKKGSFFITVSKKIPSDVFRIVDYQMYPISFGEATVYIHQKLYHNNESDSSEDEG